MRVLHVLSVGQQDLSLGIGDGLCLYSMGLVSACILVFRRAKCDEGWVVVTSSGWCLLEVGGVANVALLAVRVGVDWSGSV